ncbi:MAG: polyhydroxyalkanoic acid system family protein [Myxococcota bacterium]
MKHVVKHDLDQEKAKKAAQKAWEAYSERFSEYNPQANWTSDTHADISFQAKGIKLKGALDLEPNQIVMDLDVPFVLRVFQKKAVSVIDREIQTWVAKAKAGEI